MKSSQAFALALLVTLIVVGNFYFFDSSKKTKSVIMKRAIDGDTFETSDGTTIRLLNINTPEKNQKGYLEAKKFLSKFESKSVELEITGTDKYGRVLAKMFAPDYINLEIIKEGLGKKFLVDESELQDFRKAESAAIENSKGLWEHSEYYGCFSSDIKFKEEILSVRNSCSPVSVENWILADESRKQYKFRDISLGIIRLHTKNGEDNKTDLFWNSAQDVWNNNRDTLYLFDSSGKIVHFNSYGYSSVLVFTRMFRT